MKKKNKLSCLFVLLATFILSGCEDSDLKMIKNTNVVGRNDITWGELFKDTKVCKNPEWNVSSNNSNKKFVQVKCDLSGYADSIILSERDFYKYNFCNFLTEDNYEYKSGLFKDYQDQLLSEVKKEYSSYYELYKNWLKKRQLLIIFKLNDDGSYYVLNAMFGYYGQGFIDPNDIPNDLSVPTGYPISKWLNNEEIYKEITSQGKDANFTKTRANLFLQLKDINYSVKCLLENNESCFKSGVGVTKMPKNYSFSAIFKPYYVKDYKRISKRVYLNQLINSAAKNLGNYSYFLDVDNSYHFIPYKILSVWTTPDLDNDSTGSFFVSLENMYTNERIENAKYIVQRPTTWLEPSDLDDVVQHSYGLIKHNEKIIASPTLYIYKKGNQAYFSMPCSKKYGVEKITYKFDILLSESQDDLRKCLLGNLTIDDGNRGSTINREEFKYEKEKLEFIEQIKRD